VADEKINQLRQWMKRRKIDVYLVPHADRFQSEYLPASDERLAFLTGFTGSAGMAAITADKAVLFTDGRYTLQAAQQLDTKTYDVVEAPPASPMNWLLDHVQNGAKIGFDPWLFTVAQIAYWRRSVAVKNWDFVAIDENPVDLMWQDRPQEKLVVASDHPLEFSGASTAQKTEAIVQNMNKDAKAILFSEPALVCWLLNMRGGDVMHTPLVQSMALLDREGQIKLFTEPKKIPPELRQVWGNHVAVEALDDFTCALKKAPQPVQIDPSWCAFAVKDYCIDHEIQLIEASDPAIMLRAMKNQTEISGAFKAHEKDLTAFTEFMQWFSARDFVKETVTEMDVVAQLAQARTHAGAVDDSFSTIAGFAGNGAIVHYRVSEESNLRLQPGNLLLLDSGGQYREGTTDVTRVLPVGTPTAQMKTHYTAVLKGLINLSNARFPVGTTGGQLDALARAPVWALGLDYGHGTGHGVGSFLSVHEGPVRFRAENSVALKEGMILSIEPGIYLEGQYGIRLENLVVVVADKRPGDVKDMLAFDTLTRLPFDAQMIEWEKLSSAEIDWLKKFQTYQA